MKSLCRLPVATIKSVPNILCELRAPIAVGNAQRGVKGPCCSPLLVRLDLVAREADDFRVPHAHPS